MIGKLADLKPEDQVQLAYMECLTSCVLTYLKSTGRDYRKVLLNYWNLSYERRTLLSSKNAAYIPLRYLYGIGLSFEEASVERLLSVVKAGRSVICLSQASLLEYFPRSFLGMESSGFRHAILVRGWDAEKGVLLVADPVVGVVVELSPDRLRQASLVRADRDDIPFFVLKEPEAPYSEPDVADCLRTGAERNLHAYQAPDDGDLVQQGGDGKPDKWDRIRQRLRQRSIGARAWDLFVSDARDSVNWTPALRARWVRQNSLTMLSIRQLRARTWTVYRELLQMDEQQAEEGRLRLQPVSDAWTACNLALLKYERAGERGAEMLPALVERAGAVKEAELRFLEWLHRTAAGGGTYAEPMA
ncbi:hypothetical protein HGI30_17855 [Paenibacillus albicereus]|uniref:DUF4872 domain-containing protein n=1 Tax=Paenibacillus albicereus TaxID=2726185 RepID=A0A6H2H0N9_9BACL|nr:hypothetical protein [Paenibacillus albicereus]QJC53254.1 hypothetical protein HGI30_17855 [Paenibacillus albicereus]